MTGRVVDMNRERWLGLANAAMAAVADPTIKRRETLKLAAGRMVSATPPSTEPAAMSLCLSFRWGCVAFATSPGGLDQQLAGDALVKLGMMIRRLFGHVSPPSEPVSAVAPPPVQPALDLPEHPWMQRRDIGGA